MGSSPGGREEGRLEGSRASETAVETLQQNLAAAKTELMAARNDLGSAERSHR